MREIKFRAITQNGKVYYSNVDDVFCFYGTKVAIMENGNILYDVPSVFISQFTGLLDKHGVEIYEGDVVKSGNGRIWSVEFGKFIYTLPRIEQCEGYGFYICPSEERLKVFGNGMLREGLEVIGNVHSNPELLNTQQRGER